MKYIHSLWTDAGRPLPEIYKSPSQKEREKTQARSDTFNAKYESPAFPGFAWKIQIRRYFTGNLTWNSTIAQLLAEGILVRRATK
ncbi:MAG TPA: hypothetical protein VKK79_12015 [Candidatus Lokiarchaeia archaeon]|nr:hypothetical protein [Candidatus Lokiarchaeia archaeon]